MHITTNGLVLRSVDYKERDTILTLLTSEYGKITATARGCRKKNSPLAAGVQLFAWSEFVLYQFKGRWTVKEVAVTEQFLALRQDIKKLSLATYFAQVSELLSLEDLPQDELLALLLNSFYALGRPYDLEMVKAVFELRLMGISGFAPMLDCCSICHSPTPIHPQLDKFGGTLHCLSCGGRGLNLDSETIKSMDYILNCPPKKILQFQLQNTINFKDCCEKYLLAQLDQDIRALEFYKQL